MFDIITFGSAVVDVFISTDLPEKGKFIAYPVGSKILIKDLKFDIGGGGTNTAVAFARLGLKTGYIGKLGGDENAKFILDLLKKEKVKFLGKIDKNKRTGYSVVLDSLEHDRTILTYRGINNEIFSRDIKKINTKWLYLSSLNGSSFKTQKILAFKLKEKGVKIAYNPSEYLIKNENISNLLKIIDVLVLNLEEAILLSKNKKNYLKILQDLTGGIVVVTNKNKSIQAYDGNKIFKLKPNKIKVKERTGAGDAFSSGFVAGQIMGLSIKDSLKLGLMESENVIKYHGAKNNLIKMNLRRAVK
jgi:ribokinase